MTPAEQAGRGIAFARAALAGNPSDGYGGAVLAFAFADCRAQARATSETSATSEKSATSATSATSETSAMALSIDPPAELVAATVRRFARQYDPAARRTAIGWETDIPRGVGLGGSSAIVIATTRALCHLHGVPLEPHELASFALAVETEELGIAAGLQDRVAQAHGGLTFMDFSEEACAGSGGHGRYRQLDPRSLPPLLVAWRAEAAKHSGSVHAPLRERFERGEVGVVGCMHELGELARRAQAALRAGDTRTLAACVDGSFDVRRRMLALDPRDVAMIECARAHGLSANYTGSGGAIVAVCTDDERARRAAAAALERLGALTLVPTVTDAEGRAAPRFPRC